MDEQSQTPAATEEASSIPPLRIGMAATHFPVV